MFEFRKHIAIPTPQEMQQYATDWTHDEDNHKRRINNANQLLKNVWVYIEVLDLPREVKACSLMEIAMSLIWIITEPKDKKKIKVSKT